MTTSKSKRNVVSLPDNFCNVLDNLVDNKMICNRTDALKQIILEQHKLHPDTIKFIEKQENIPLPKWLTQNNLDTLKALIKDDSSEQHAAIILDEIRTSLKIWKEIGVEGLHTLRKIRAANKKTEAEKSAPPQ